MTSNSASSPGGARDPIMGQPPRHGRGRLASVNVSASNVGGSVHGSTEGQRGIEDADPRVRDRPRRTNRPPRPGPAPRRARRHIHCRCWCPRPLRIPYSVLRGHAGPRLRDVVDLIRAGIEAAARSCRLAFVVVVVDSCTGDAHSVGPGGGRVATTVAKATGVPSPAADNSLPVAHRPAPERDLAQPARAHHRRRLAVARVDDSPPRGRCGCRSFWAVPVSRRSVALPAVVGDRIELESRRARRRWSSPGSRLARTNARATGGRPGSSPTAVI